MAKKTQAVQLQTEVANDEEWEKLLQRDGLIIVDVYSDWCGSCQGMAANLKKLKLEVGGDMMQLTTAKCDNITPLARFRAKSEPTWMFISKGKMVNLMFGADAPKLTRLILEELKLEQLAVSGEKPREGREITELHEEEQVRYDAAESIRKAAADKEEAKRAKELRERRMAECENILEHLTHLGVILVLPNSRDKYAEALSDLISEAGLAIQQTEKVQFTEDMYHDLICMAPDEDIFDDASLENLLNGESLFLLIKMTRSTVIEDMHDTILGIVYGETKAPPGDAGSPYDALCESNENGMMGIWSPIEPYVLATVFKMFFPKLSSEYFLPEPERQPEHFAIVFDHKKVPDALEVMKQYPKQILQYGFFTTEIAEETQLIAKSVHRLEAETPSKRNFKEKLVVEVSEKKSECLLAFAQLGPTYMSPNVDEVSQAEKKLTVGGIGAVFSDIESSRIEIKLTEQMIEELTFFSDFKFGDRSVRDCVDGRIALALLIKRSAENLPGDIDDIVLQAVYGNSRRHPGDERSASFKLMTRNDEDDNEDDILIGVWAPQNKFCKAFGLKNLFPNVSGPFKLPEVELPPHYVIVGYDAFKSRDVMELSDKYPGQVMAYGFFTTDIPPAAQLISKTVKEFEERTIPTTYEEKIVVQLAKTNPECFMAFSELGPSYMSSDAVAGEIDCQYFFPPGYNTPVEEVAEVKKKSKKKSKSKPTAITSTQEETVSQATSDLHKEQSERDHGEEDTEENVTDDERAADGGVEDEDDAALGEDKATSPIDHND